MNTDSPQPYDVTISRWVSDKIREFAVEAKQRGDGEAFLGALREFYYRLRIYPQFGDPLIDLQEQVGHIRIGIVPPLSMRYAVLEEHRQVFSGALPVLMPKSPDAEEG